MRAFSLTLILIYSIGLNGQTPCGDSAKGWQLEKTNSKVSLEYPLPVLKSVQNPDSLRLGHFSAVLGRLQYVKSIQTSDSNIRFIVNSIPMKYERHGFQYNQIVSSLREPLICRGELTQTGNKYSITFSYLRWVSVLNNNEYPTYLSEYFNKEGCIKTKYLDKMNNSLELVRKCLNESFCDSTLSANSPDTFNIVPIIKTVSISSNPIYLPDSVLISYAGQSMKKSLNQRLSSIAFMTGGAVMTSIWLRSGREPDANLVLGVGSWLVGFGLGISSLTWEYKSANYLIQVAPNSVKLKF